MMEIRVCTVLYVVLGTFYSGQLYLNKGNAPDLIIAQIAIIELILLIAIIELMLSSVHAKFFM